MLKLCLPTLLITAVTAFNSSLLSCTSNEHVGNFISCEPTCRNLEKFCTFGSKCICRTGLFRDLKTNSCVVEEKCPGYAYIWIRTIIWGFINALLSVLTIILPSPFQNVLTFLMYMNTVRRLISIFVPMNL